jgi:hypothetical protein
MLLAHLSYLNIDSLQHDCCEKFKQKTNQSGTLIDRKNMEMIGTK